MQFMNSIDQIFWIFTHQLFFHFITNLWQESDQHLQHFTRQVWFIGGLTQRQLPVESVRVI